jgi:hypothetical protein
MRITRVFFDIDMRLAFQGLNSTAKSAKTILGPESRVIFINKSMTSFKLMVDGQFLVYYKHGMETDAMISTWWALALTSTVSVLALIWILSILFGTFLE